MTKRRRLAFAIDITSVIIGIAMVFRFAFENSYNVLLAAAFLLWCTYDLIGSYSEYVESKRSNY